MFRRNFVRTGVAALLAQWIKIPELTLEEPSLFYTAQYTHKNFGVSFVVSQELLQKGLADDYTQMLIEQYKQLYNDE